MIEAYRSLEANLRAETGQTMAEYAIVLAVITIAVVVVLGTLGNAIKSKLTSVVSVL